MARLRYNALKTGSAGSGVALSLGASLTSSATSITFNAALTHSNGTAVPTITGSDYIPLEILDSSGNLSEIVWLTAYTAGATTGTIARGKEGSTGVAHSSGDRVAHGPTASDIPNLPVRATRTAGDFSTSSTSFVATDASVLNLVVPAVAGDLLKVGLSGRVGPGAAGVYMTFDLASVDGSGTILNRWRGGAADGVVDWMAPPAIDWPISGETWWPVVSGDLVSGAVTLRLYWKVSSASSRTVYSRSDIPTTFWATNLGQ